MHIARKKYKNGDKRNSYNYLYVTIVYRSIKLNRKIDIWFNKNHIIIGLAIYDAIF